MGDPRTSSTVITDCIWIFFIKRVQDFFALATYSYNELQNQKVSLFGGDGSTELAHSKTFLRWIFLQDVLNELNCMNE
jgi:hypothetical protein